MLPRTLALIDDDAEYSEYLAQHLRGTGIDLADLREYQFHDDVRHIDWNVTARMQTPYVRQFTEDRDINAWFLVDLSPSSQFGSGDSNKRDVSIEFTALMARLLTQHGNRTGAMLYGSKVDTVLPPRADRRHVLRMIHSMIRRPVLGAVGATKLGVLLQRAAQTVTRRSAIFVVSDFISEDGWQTPLMRLAARHDVVVVRVVDPLEAALPNVGLMTLEDPETGEQLFVDTTDPALRKRYASLSDAREQTLTDAFARADTETLRLSTDQALLDNLLAYVEMRKRMPRRSRGTSTLRSKELAA
ncbi:MAG: DUF58 domain-containing protein [Aquincola sp.]|nr:DUF58 domain-containing protein [Aquincola sp.]